MRRLFVYEGLVDILVEVVDVVATSNNAVYSAAKIAELRGRLDEAIAVEDAVFSAQAERVREGEYESLVRSFARVIAAVDNVGAVVVGRRQRRSDERMKQRRLEVAKRWRSGVDRQAEVGRVRMLQREALKRLYVQRRSEVIVIDGDDSSEDDEEDEKDDEESSGEDDDSLAEEGDEEMRGVDDDPDGQVDL
jgi:hypothetical protein